MVIDKLGWQGKASRHETHQQTHYQTGNAQTGNPQTGNPMHTQRGDVASSVRSTVGFLLMS